MLQYTQFLFLSALLSGRVVLYNQVPNFIEGVSIKVVPMSANQKVSGKRMM